MPNETAPIFSGFALEIFGAYSPAQRVGNQLYLPGLGRKKAAADCSA